MSQAFSTVIVFLALAASASAQTGSWATKADGIAPFGYGGYATNGTYLYVFGGQAYSGTTIDSAATRYLRRYDPIVDSWSALADLPGQVHYNTGAYYGGFLYSIGNIGYPPAPGGAWVTVPENGIMKYSIAANTWTILAATIPAHGYEPAAATLGSKIYITGGSLGSTSNAVSEFDPATDLVTAKNPMPVGLRRHAMVTEPVGNRIYTFGGFSLAPGAAASTKLASTYEYTPATDSWTRKADMILAPRTNAVPFAIGGRCFVTGGNTGVVGTYGTATTDVLEYNPATDTWTPRASFALARNSHAAATIGTKAYLFGGTVPSGSGLPSPWISTQEYTPPNYGSAPTVTSVEQMVGATSIPQGGSVTVNGFMRFVAHTTDPDAGTHLLEVQIKPAADLDWSAAVTVLSGPMPAGDVSIDTFVATLGAFDWRWRLSDDMGNFAGTGMGWTSFGDALVSPDFTVTVPVSNSSSGGSSGGGGGCSAGGPATFGVNTLAIFAILAIGALVRRT